jgi:hypothetical protein
MAVLNMVLIVGPFRNLVVIDVILFISSVRLRAKEPEPKRPFRVPFGAAGFAALFSGPVLYYAFRAICGGPRHPSREAGNEALTLAEAEASEDTA